MTLPPVTRARPLDTGGASSGVLAPPDGARQVALPESPQGGQHASLLPSGLPWSACKDGDCSCGQIFSVAGDHPVAKVDSGNIGDDYPALRFVEGCSSLDAKVEAYMAQITYWHVPREVAAANAKLIVRAVNSHHDLLDALRSIADQAEVLSRDEVVAFARAAIARASDTRTAQLASPRTAAGRAPQDIEDQS